MGPPPWRRFLEFAGWICEVAAMKVYDSLKYGRENAIPSKVLAEVLGFSSVRELQKAVEAERAAGAVILCDSQGAGYYLSNDPLELRRFTRTLNARAANTLKAAESAQRALDAATGQEPKESR